MFLFKSHTLRFYSHYSRATGPFEKIHTNVSGIEPTLSKLGYKYHVTFIDDHS